MKDAGDPRTATIALVMVLLASCVNVAAQEADAALVGTILDDGGQPLAGCRVIVQVAGGTDVFVSRPSDAEGRYRLAVPAGNRYALVAVVSPTAGRIALPESEPVDVGQAVVSRDVRVQLPAAPEPRTIGTSPRGPDRLFLSFVEDPAVVERARFEIQADFADFESGDSLTARGTAAVSFPGLPRVELGLRAGYSETDIGAFDDSGVTDTELWAKFLLRRWGNGDVDLSTGVLMTLPTGDEDVGLGRDAMQSKLFVAASHLRPSAVFVWNIGVGASEHGEIAGRSLDGAISASAGVGVLVPVTQSVSLTFEANYEDERFDGLESRSDVLFGANWRGRRSVLRAALAGGLEDSSPDLVVLAGYAYEF